MNKLEPIGIRFSNKEREAIIKAAKADDRSISAFARKIIIDALKKAGWIK